MNLYCANCHNFEPVDMMGVTEFFIYIVKDNVAHLEAVLALTCKTCGENLLYHKASGTIALQHTPATAPDGKGPQLDVIGLRLVCADSPDPMFAPYKLNADLMFRCEQCNATWEQKWEYALHLNQFQAEPIVITLPELDNYEFKANPSFMAGERYAHLN